MSSLIRLHGTTNESAQTVIDRTRLANVSIANAFRNFSGWIMGVASGSRDLNCVINTGLVKAAGSITFTGAPTAAETCSIANVTFTARASGASGNEFNIGGNVTDTATNLAAAINASSNLSSLVTATSAVGVVTISAYLPGKMGNGLQLSESLSNATASAFASGSEGTAVSLAKGN